MTEAEVLEGEKDAEVGENQGDRWTFVAVLPETSFVHTLHHGERTKEQAGLFIKELKCGSDGHAPFFTSDGWFYSDVLGENYCTYVHPPYKGRGRRPRPVRVLDSGLRYAQVCKKRDDKGKIVEITTRIVLGDEVQILDLLGDAGRSRTINTSFVESRNGKMRKDDARLIRKTLCHSKKAVFHDAHADLLAQVTNYARTNDALKVLVNPAAALFEQKYLHRTPAMAEGLIDKILTIKELLFRRPKPIGIP